MKYLFNVPYSGKIDRIEAGQVAKLALKEETESYSIQQDRVAAAGLDLSVIAQTTDGFIVFGDAKSAQGAYDAAFGGLSNAPKARANALVQFPKPEAKLGDMLKSSFAYAADRFHMSEKFGFAAAPKADNENFVYKPTPFALAA